VTLNDAPGDERPERAPVPAADPTHAHPIATAGHFPQPIEYGALVM